jgi:replicative DNA helicase
MEIKKGIHYSTELEQAILGICLLEKDGFGRIYGLIEEECFYHPGHQQVYSAIKKMFQEGMMIDIFTAVDFIQRVRQIPELENYNTAYFVTRLTNYVVSGAHLEYHCHIVKMMWMEREIINLTHGGTGKLEGSISEQIKTIQDKLHSLQTKAT